MDTKQQSNTASALVVELPDAFKQHDPSLKGATLQLAVMVGSKHPQIVQAAVELRAAITAAGEKYYHIVHALRAAKLPKKEASALLYGLGFNKNRVHELNKVSSLPEEVWKKYSEKTVGFKAALAIEAGAEEEGEGEGTAVGTAKKRTKTKIHPLPKPLRDAITEAVAPWLAKVRDHLPDPTKGGKRTEYGFTYEANGKTLYFQIFADNVD